MRMVICGFSTFACLHCLQEDWPVSQASFSARITAAVNREATSESAKYTLFEETGLGGLRLLVLARRDILPLVGNAHQAVVAAGVGGLLPNKGAVAISCQVMGTHLGFVNAHLAADNDESALLERNRMYRVCSAPLKSRALLERNRMYQVCSAPLKSRALLERNRMYRVCSAPLKSRALLECNRMYRVCSVPLQF
jgi:hypothetical protein